MKATFLCSIQGLVVRDDLGRGDRLDEITRISNSRKQISELIIPSCIPTIGALEVSALLGGAPVVFSVEELSEGVTPQQHLISKLYQVETFLTVLWLLMDNAANAEQGFVMYHDGNSWVATSNFIAALNLDCTGKKSERQISREQLRKARRLYRETVELPDRPFERPATQLLSGANRVARAVYFVQAARASSDLALRVAHYCTALETLFATSQSELAHQLSERVACFLHDSVEDRLKAYASLKSAYGFRSKTVHGATIRESHLHSLKSAVVFCDDVLRQILLRVLDGQVSASLFEQRPEEFDNYMLRLIFGGK